MEPLYAATPSSSGGYIGAPGAGESPAAIPATAAGGAPQRGLAGAAMVFQQQHQPPAAPGGPAAFHSVYARPLGARGAVASVCALPAATPSAFMPLQQQQQLRSARSTSTGHNSTRYTVGALPGGTGPADVYYRSSFAPSKTYPVPGNLPSLYRAPPGVVSALSPPAASAGMAGPPGGGSGPLSSYPSGEDRKLQGPVGMREAVSYSAASTTGGISSGGSPPLISGAADSISDGTADTSVEPTPAVGSVEAVALVPGRVSVESLSAEDCGLLRQTRHLLQEGISNTFECITLLSGILLSQGTSPLIHHLMQAWEEAGQQQQSDEKMLCLLYVMNDALQKCRRRGCPFLLLLALEPLHRFCWKVGKQHGSILRSCTRVVRILKDAKAFGPLSHPCSSQIADALLAALQGNGAAALLPPPATVQKVLEASAEEASNEIGATRAAQQQENTAGAESGEGKQERKKHLQRLLHAPSSAAGGEVGGRGNKMGAGSAGDGISQHKLGGGVSATALLRGGSVFLQQARISSNMRTLPAAIDTFLLQYPVPGDEALAAHINEKFPGDPQEAALRQQISDALGSLAVAQTALADKAVARRRVEERLRELQYEQQRLRERAERVQRAAAGGAQAQLLLWQQMQQQLQQGGDRIDFSPEGIAAEQERLANLIKAAHAKLRVLLKTEWNRRVELQGVLLSLAQAIEARLDVILPMHVHCREVKSVIDRASLLLASRQQRKQRQERAEEEQRQQQQQQIREPEQKQQQGHEENLRQHGQETQGPEMHPSHTKQQGDVVGQEKGELQGQQDTAQQDEQLEKKDQQKMEERQESVTHLSDEKKVGETYSQKSPQLSEQLRESDPAERQAVQDQEQGVLVSQRVDELHEGVSITTENAAPGREPGSDIAAVTQQEDEQGDVEEEMEGLEDEPSFHASLNDDEASPQEDLYSEEQLLHEHTNHDTEQQDFEQQHEGQPFEQLEEHDGWLV